MKKLLSLMMVFALLGTLAVGCGKKEQASTSAGKNDTKQASETKSETKKEAKVFKLANDGAPDHPIAQGLARFSEEVGKASNGSLKVDVFNNGQLGQEKDAVEGVKLGTIQLTKANCGNITGYVNELNAFTLAFILKIWNIIGRYWMAP